MKKGFTLIELLGVMIVISGIALITIPIVSSIINDSQNKVYDSQVKTIKDSANKYVLDNIDTIDKSLYLYLSVEDLKKAGFLENKDIKNPKTNEVMNGCVIVKYIDNKFNFEYNDSTCSEINETNYPIITIENNEYTIKVEAGSNLDLSTINSKVSATSHSGADLEVGNPVITKNGKVVSSIDTSILNSKYILTYTVTDPSNNLSSKDKIKVIIVDTTPPVISVNGNSSNQTVTTKLNERFQIPDAAVTDNSGEVIESVISGSVNTEVLGTYTITYKAVDSSGNDATYILTVEVTN